MSTMRRHWHCFAETYLQKHPDYNGVKETYDTVSFALYVHLTIFRILASSFLYSLSHSSCCQLRAVTQPARRSIGCSGCSVPWMVFIGVQVVCINTFRLIDAFAHPHVSTACNCAHLKHHADLDCSPCCAVLSQASAESFAKHRFDNAKSPKAFSWLTLNTGML